MGGRVHFIPKKDKIPSDPEALEWLLVLCTFTQIPMYQITRILQLTFKHPYDPVRTRALYEDMNDEDGNAMDTRLCRTIERGPEDKFAVEILREAAILRARIESGESSQK
ncbi:MAG: hypothetical protein Q9183_000537 [Haloplaca sp. 2 TL-2023]